MWKCPICETNNEDQHNSCIVCGHERGSIPSSTKPDNDIDFMEDICHVSSVDSNSVSEKKPDMGGRLLNFFFDVKRDDNDDDPDDDWDGEDDDFDDDWDDEDDDFDDDWDDEDDDLDDISEKRISSAVYGIIYKLKTIFICALVGFAIFAVTYLFISIMHANDDTDITFKINATNSELVGDILYMNSDQMTVSWSSNLDNARYKVEFLNDSGVTYIYYDSTAMTEISIVKDYFHTDGIHTLRITLENGSSDITKELHIKPEYQAYDDSVG